MERWCGKVALVTGASGGIGASLSADLVKKGLTVVGIARRVENIQKLSDSLKGSKGKLIALKCDLSNIDDIEEVFSFIKKEYGAPNIVINNAAFLSMEHFGRMENKTVKSMFEINITALTIVCNMAIKQMTELPVEEGHIVNINSYVGHLIFGVPGLAPYCASKNAVTVLTEALRRELGSNNRTIKVTSFSPGIVDTDLSGSIHIPDHIPRLTCQDVSDSIVYVLSTPKTVNVTELTLMKTGDVQF